MGERPLLILYGSQTGCAQEVAERIGWEGRRRHFNVRVAGMDEYDVLGLPCEPLVVLCASTTGQGDAPDNMRAFWAFLLRRSLGADSLSGTTFAVFGLGDSGYAKYNAVAKRLDRRLEMLGAARLVPLGLGDDQARAGYDQALDPWLSALWDAALGLMPLPAGAVIDTSDTLPPSRYCVTPLPRDAPLSAHAPALPHAPEMPSARRPFMARIVEDQLLTAPGIDREVRHFELDLAGSGLAYQPGDIVAVQPRNAPALVRAFAELCGLDLDARVLLAANPLAAAAGEVVPEPVCGWGTVTVRDILERHMDFMATPRRRFFEVLRHFCPEPLLQERIAGFCFCFSPGLRPHIRVALVPRAERACTCVIRVSTHGIRKGGWGIGTHEEKEGEREREREGGREGGSKRENGATWRERETRGFLDSAWIRTESVSERGNLLIRHLTVCCLCAHPRTTTPDPQSWLRPKDAPISMTTASRSSFPPIVYPSTLALALFRGASP